ncbi:MAG: energy transducer TonB [Verrucomicrobiota bacterium]
MLKFSTLKFCFAVSLLVHAMVFGVVKWVGNNQRPVALQHEPDVMTLQLVAAPMAAVETVVAPAAQPSRPTPEPFPATPQPPPPAAAPPPPAVEKAEAVPLLPEPVPAPGPTQTEFPPPPPVPSPATKTETSVSPSPAATGPIGDGSSARLGADATTSEARRSVLAHPNYLKNPEPPYPLSARRRQQQGLVLLEVKVSARGEALEVSVKESSGHAILDEAAVNAVREWEFAPARLGATALDSRIEVPVRFKLAR